MKRLLRTPLHVYLALMSVQFLLSSFNFGDNYVKNVTLVVLAFYVFYLLNGGILKLLTFPFGCLGTGLLNLILTSILLFALITVLNGFTIVPVDKVNLIYSEIMLPLRNFGLVGSIVVTSLTLGIIYNFLEWLCSCRR